MTGTRIKVGLYNKGPLRSKITLRSILGTNLSVVPGPLIFVLDKKTNGCPQTDAMFNTGLEMDEVFLITLPGVRMSTMKQ